MGIPLPSSLLAGALRMGSEAATGCGVGIQKTEWLYCGSVNLLRFIQIEICLSKWDENITTETTKISDHRESHSDSFQHCDVF